MAFDAPMARTLRLSERANTLNSGAIMINFPIPVTNMALIDLLEELADDLESISPEAAVRADFFEDGFYALLGLLQGSPPDLKGECIFPPVVVNDLEEAEVMISDFTEGWADVKEEWLKEINLVESV